MARPIHSCASGAGRYPPPGAADLKPEADGELENGVEAEVSCDVEEIVSFLPNGCLELCISDRLPAVGVFVFGFKGSFVGGGEFAAAEVGVQFVPLASAGDYVYMGVASW